MAKTKAGVAQRAADILDREVSQICARWSLRIWRDIYSHRPDLMPHNLEDSAVPLVRGLADALRRGEPTELKAPWTKAAREHAAERRSRNIPVGDLQREYQVMRQEIWATLERELTSVSIKDVYGLARSLDAALDTMATISADTYAGQLQAALEDASRLASVVEASVDAILYVSPEGTITNWTRGAQEIYGYSADEVVGKPLTVLIPPERSEQFNELLARLRRGETIRRFDTELVRQDGTRVAIALTAAPIRDANGQTTGFSWVSHDITELVDLIRLREDVISTVSHDIRQPLAAILGQSQLADRALERGRVEAARRSLQSITTSAHRMNTMIQDLVDSVRMEAGSLHLDIEPVDLEPYIRELLQRSATSLDVSRVHLSIEPNTPPVLADPDRLERILLNLVSNALKYSDPGTPVDLRVSRKNGMALVAVKDRGIGISPEDLPHIFERFYRGKGAKRESLGLGLYIARMLVETHGGRIWAESKLGQGTTFYFTLPLAPER